MKEYPFLDNNTEHWLYAYWRKDGQLLYVGVTSQPEIRHDQHIHASAWFGDVDRYELFPSYPSGRTAYAAEKVYIHHGRPLYNMRHNPANKHLSLPEGTWMLPTAQVGQAIYEMVNADRAKQFREQRRAELAGAS